MPDKHVFASLKKTMTDAFSCTLAKKSNLCASADFNFAMRCKQGYDNRQRKIFSSEERLRDSAFNSWPCYLGPMEEIPGARTMANCDVLSRDLRYLAFRASLGRAGKTKPGPSIFSAVLKTFFRVLVSSLKLGLGDSVALPSLTSGSEP